ncbi:MAG: hypothetical protein HKN09_13920 [Saprospiraceae bacterium]|nr:hypothetical protein [Saprospiraceae bacterium]
MKHILIILLLSISYTHAQDLAPLRQRIKKLQLYRDTMIWPAIDSLIALTNTPDQKQANIDARITKGGFFLTFSKKEAAIKYLEDLHASHYQEADQKNKYRLLNKLALAHMSNAEYSKALDYALKSYFQAEENNDSLWLKDSAMKIGQSYILLGRKDQSIPYLTQALDLAYTHNDKIRIIQVSNNLLNAHNDKLDQEPFKSYLIRYINYLGKNKIPLDSKHAGILNILEIDVDLIKLLELYDNISDFEMSNTRMTLVEFIYRELVKKGLTLKAIEVLNQELSSGIHDNSQEVQKNLNSYLAQSYALTGNWEKAYEHLQKYTSGLKSLRGENIQARIDSLNVLYNTAQKEKQIAKQQLALSQKKRQNQVLGGSVLAIMFISGLIIYMVRRKWAYEKNLRLQQKEIQEQKLLRLEQENKIMAMDYVLLGEENERKRIAKDLHDSLGSLLSSAQLQLNKIQNEIDALKGMNLFSNAEALIKNAANEVRRISHDMMPEALINLGLQASIEDLASSINNSARMNVSTFFSSFNEKRIDDKQKLGLFRIVQELSQNAIKHSNASQLIIQASMEEKTLTLVVEDNGVGFDVQKQLEDKKGIGLQSVISRVKHLDGEIEITSDQDKQTVFVIQLSI